VIASIPHGGSTIPAAILSTLLLEPDRLYADWYTAELFSFLPDLDVPTITATAHRVVADPNRNPDVEWVAPWPNGTIATTSPRGEPLYAEPPGDAENRMTQAFWSYHASLDQLIAGAGRRFPSVVLLDLHSFGMPLPADIILGDRHGRSASPDVVDAIEASFVTAGFSVTRNRPFAGGHIVERCGRPPAVHAVQVEINQRCYLDPRDIDREDWRRPRFDADRIQRAAAMLRTAVSTLIRTLGGRAESAGDIALRAESLTQLRQHVTLPSSFEYRSVFDVMEGAGGITLRERPLAEPRFKHYDSLENPLEWLQRFDTSRWILIAAYEGEERVGGVIGAIDTPELDMLEGRSDLAVLWDVRIAPHRRRQGVGALLFRAVEAWARAMGCKELKRNAEH
jgi:N-formylglutamate amidohydrolase/GNAT superfamily N-acetyltransferase